MLDRGLRYDLCHSLLGAKGRHDLCDTVAAADALTAYLGKDHAPDTHQAFTREQHMTITSRVDATDSHAL